MPHKNNYTKFQSGGKYVGKGAYGCVFVPNIPCNDKFKKISEKYISKIVNKLDLKDEYEDISTLNLNEIDPEYKYYIYPIYVCDITQNLLRNETQLRHCSVLKHKTIPSIEKTYANILQPNGGIDLEKLNSQLNFQFNWLNYLNLFKGIALLHKNKLFHKDIKPPNIVFHPENSFRIIDFGLCVPYIEQPIPNESEIENRVELARSKIIKTNSIIEAFRTKSNILRESVASKFFGTIKKSQEKIDKVEQKVRENEGRIFIQEEHLKHYRQQIKAANKELDTGWYHADYLYWPLDYKIINYIQNNREAWHFCNTGRSDNCLRGIDTYVLDKVKTYENNQQWYLRGKTQQRKILGASLKQFLIDAFVDNKYNTPTKLKKITDKMQYTIDVFSLGIFLSEDYIRCSHRAGRNDAYRNAIIIMINKMISLNPNTRPFIHEVITEFMHITHKYLIKREQSDLSERFNDELKELEDLKIITAAQKDIILDTTYQIPPIPPIPPIPKSSKPASPPKPPRSQKSHKKTLDYSDLPRQELQQLAIKNKIKANIKSEFIIDALVELNKS